MRLQLGCFLFLTLAFISCTTTNNPVTNIYVVDSLAPTITGFSPDTVWTLGTLTIHGKHLGYGDVYVAIDTTQAQLLTAYDSIISVSVPQDAQTGTVRVSTIYGSSTSAKPVVVEYTQSDVGNTFSPHIVNDTAPVGGTFSIPGTGMNHYHGYLRLTDSTGVVLPILYPIDSVFANRIIARVPANGLSGNLYLNDSLGFYYVGTLTITRPSAWNTLSIIWDHVTVTETHTRMGYVNGPSNPIDSTWQTTATYVGQRDVNVTGVPFMKTAGELQYTLAAPTIQITWDTTSQTAYVFYGPYSISQTATHTVDTEWDSWSFNLPAMLPVTSDIEFTLPSLNYQITEDSTDSQGLVNWQELTTSTFNSGSFDLILKQ